MDSEFDRSYFARATVAVPLGCRLLAHDTAALPHFALVQVVMDIPVDLEDAGYGSDDAEIPYFPQNQLEAYYLEHGHGFDGTRTFPFFFVLHLFEFVDAPVSNSIEFNVIRSESSSVREPSPGLPDNPTTSILDLVTAPRPASHFRLTGEEDHVEFWRSLDVAVLTLSLQQRRELRERANLSELLLPKTQEARALLQLLAIANTSRSLPITHSKLLLSERVPATANALVDETKLLGQRIGYSHPLQYEMMFFSRQLILAASLLPDAVMHSDLGKLTKLRELICDLQETIRVLVKEEGNLREDLVYGGSS